MRGLRSQSSIGLEWRTADEMDADITGKKKTSPLSSIEAPSVSKGVGQNEENYENVKDLGYRIKKRGIGSVCSGNFVD
jgi:hypothetical protein